MGMGRRMEVIRLLSFGWWSVVVEGGVGGGMRILGGKGERGGVG